MKYGKKLGNQVLGGLSYLKQHRDGEHYSGRDYQLIYPEDNMGDEHDDRPFINVVSVDMLIRCCNDCPQYELTLICL